MFYLLYFASQTIPILRNFASFIPRNLGMESHGFPGTWELAIR